VGHDLKGKVFERGGRAVPKLQYSKVIVEHPERSGIASLETVRAVRLGDRVLDLGIRKISQIEFEYLERKFHICQAAQVEDIDLRDGLRAE